MWLQSPNVAPTVNISPAANAQFTQGDNISITANASDTDGTITKVEFFNGNILLETDTTTLTAMPGQTLRGLEALSDCQTDDKEPATVLPPNSDQVVANTKRRSNRKASRSCRKRPVHSRGQHQHHCKTQSDTDGNKLQSEFFNGKTPCWNRHYDSLQLCLDKCAPL